MPTPFGIDDMMQHQLASSGGSEHRDHLMLGSLNSGSPHGRGILLDDGDQRNMVGGAQTWRITQPLPRPGKYNGIGPKKFARFKAQLVYRCG